MSGGARHEPARIIVALRERRTGRVLEGLPWEQHDDLRRRLDLGTRTDGWLAPGFIDLDTGEFLTRGAAARRFPDEAGRTRGYGVADSCDFECIRRARTVPYAIVHIPHSSTHIPDDLRHQLSLSAADLDRELLCMTDWYTDELFADAPQPGATLQHPVSRLVIDPERFPDDCDEPMARLGMGAAYTRTSDGRALRTLRAAERETLMQRFYWPHHQALTARVTAALEAHGSCLVIDGHSFPSVRLPHEGDPNPHRPEICLGTDGFHTPTWLVEAALEAVRAEGWDVALDTPFAGSMVPAAHYRKEVRVLSIMIEVRRDLYIDEAAGEKRLAFDRVRAGLGRVMTGLVDTAATFGARSREGGSR